MTEPIRLIIWDLDDTFWQGTLIEGGVRAVGTNHDLLIELCRRGIMNSICARTDIEPARLLLRTFGLWDYFIFPSIDWSPQPARIGALIDWLRLPAGAVLLIDNDPAHRAAAKALLPELQVAGPDCIPELLGDARFAGRDDPDMSRLRQYKAMERHGIDMPSAGNNTGYDIDFLRTSEIVVAIETNVAAHIDRAVALVNSVNPLNFTGNYLPPHLPSARQELLEAIGSPQARAGLIRVSDRYGDHGLCGFYLLEGAPPDARLTHFCLSGRIVGMGVEAWLYQWLGRPALGGAGDAPASLSAPVDWIGSDNATSLAGQVHIPQIIVRGGAGFDAIADQCRLNSGDVVLEDNRVEWHVLLNHDTTTNLALTLRDHSPAVLAELNRIGFRQPDLLSRLWTIAPGGIAIFGGWGDVDARRYRYKPTGLDLSFQIKLLQPDFGLVTEPEILAFGEAKGLIPETTDHVRMFVRYVAQAYEALPGVIEAAQARLNLHAIFSAFPPSATLFLLLPPSKGAGGKPRYLYDRPGVSDYRAAVREVAALYDHVTLIDTDDFVTGLDDFEAEADRLNRAVFSRIYQAIMARYGPASALPAAA